MLNGNGWATSSEIAAASMLLDLQIDVWLHQRNVYSKNTFIKSNNIEAAAISEDVAHPFPFNITFVYIDFVMLCS
jgi:hypothetical protein